MFLNGGRGIDVHALNLLGERPVGVGNGGTSGERTCLCGTDGARGGNTRPLGADAPAVPVSRRLRCGERDEREHTHEECADAGF